MKRILLTQYAYAKRIGVTKQAVANAVKTGKLKLTEQDGKKYINPNLKKNKLYENNITKERLSDRINGKNIKTEIEVIDNSKKKRNKHSKDIQPYNKGKIDIYELQQQYYAARAEKEKQMAIHKKLQNAKMRGELLDREAVYKIFMYLDKVHSNLERLGNIFLSDVADEIITAGKLQPSTRGKWVTAILEQIDDAKKDVTRKIKEIEKEQAG